MIFRTDVWNGEWADKADELAREIRDSLDVVRPSPSEAGPFDPRKERFHLREISSEYSVDKYALDRVDVVALPTYVRDILRTQIGGPCSTGKTRVVETLLKHGILWEVIERWLGHLELKQGVMSPALRFNELDVIGKTCFQSGFSPAWYLGYDMRAHTGKRRLSDESLAWLAGVTAEAAGLLARTTRDCVSNPSLALPLVSAPSGTNHGWPSWRKDDVDLALHYLLSSTFRSMDDVRAAEDFFEIPLCGTFFSRTGHTYKAAEMWDQRDDGAMSKEKVKGVYPRRRAVMGYPNCLNNMERPEMKAFHKTMFKYGVWRITDPTELWAYYGKHFTRVRAEDLKGYDSHVSYTVLHDWNTKVMSNLWPVRGMGWFYPYQISMPMLVPGPSARNGWYVKREGYLGSGSIHTSRDGTGINSARILDCMSAATGRSVASLVSGLVSREWAIAILGDDTLIMGDDTFFDNVDWDVYDATTLELGFPIEVVAPMFLMTMPTAKGVPTHGLVSRFLQQTIFPERPKADDRVELVGLLDRLERVRTHPCYSSFVAPLTEFLVREGWGMTLVEAQAFCEGFIASNSTSHGELSDFIDEMARTETLPYFGALRASVEERRLLMDSLDADHDEAARRILGSSKLTNFFSSRDKVAADVLRRVDWIGRFSDFKTRTSVPDVFLRWKESLNE